MEWKEIKDFINYEVSSEGVVRNKNTQQIIKTSLNNSGYLKLILYRDNKPYTRTIHKLVANTFLGESDLEVNHIDGNKLNNNVSNLEYLSRSDNIKHAFKNNLIPIVKDFNSTSKRICCSNGKEYKSIHEASKDLNIERVNIRKVLSGKRKTTHGFTFSYL